MDYTPSRYVKEELPTWAEIHEWYGQSNYYDPGRDNNVIEPYWKIPRKLYLIATCCNQFNKMIDEDGYDEKIRKYLNDAWRFRPDTIFFALHDFDDTEKNTDKAGTIYSLQDCYNPFIKNPEIRKVVNPNHFYMLTFMYTFEKNNRILDESSCPEEMIHDIYNILCNEIEEYFREPIGWKDENGNMISDMNKQIKCDSGVDPAL